MIKFIVFGLPVPKGRPRFTRKGFAYTPSNTREAERDFKVQALQFKPNKPLEGPIRLVVNVFKPKPKSKKKSIVHMTTRPDLDNYIKLVEDAMNGIFFKDDSQIVEIHATKSYGDARTEIELSEVV